MPLYQIHDKKLVGIKEKPVKLERELQLLTEENLESIFGLKFVSGASNREFSVSTQEQDFYLDTLAFDETRNSFVIIEYKKDKSFSVIDQGFAYLAAMLNSQADFVLEINEQLHKSLTKKDINWEESRIIFIANEFTNYQRNAINFKDLPIFLYEAKFYENGIVDYNPIKPYKTTESIKKVTTNKTIQQVSRQVKVYTVDDLFQNNWSESRELYDLLNGEILNLGTGIMINVTKLYVAYKLKKNGQWYNFAEVVPQANGLKIHLDIKTEEIHDPNRMLEDVSKVGHWATGNTKVSIKNKEDVYKVIILIKQAFNLVSK